MNKTLFVVMPVHNRKAATRKCLNCLYHQTYPFIKIIVVDDGSNDGTQEMIEQEFSEVIRLRGNGNLWWTGATNMGIKYAINNDADLILTLNNDVLVKSNYIHKLINAHLDNLDALIGSIELTQDTPHILLYAGIKSFNPWTAKSMKNGSLLKEYSGELSGLLPTISLPGRGVLIPSDVFMTIGMFDEDSFPQYAADFDFSVRAAKAGFSLLVHSENPVYSPYEPNRPGGMAQSWGDFLKTFFIFRSSNYLPISLRYGFRHHPHKWYFPFYATLDVIRKLVSFSRSKTSGFH